MRGPDVVGLLFPADTVGALERGRDICFSPIDRQGKPHLHLMQRLTQKSRRSLSLDFEGKRNLTASIRRFGFSCLSFSSLMRAQSEIRGTNAPGILVAFLFSPQRGTSIRSPHLPRLFGAPLHHFLASTHTRILLSDAKFSPLLLPPRRLDLPVIARTRRGQVDEGGL